MTHSPMICVLALVVFAAHGIAAQTYCTDQVCGAALLNAGWTVVAEVRDCATRFGGAGDVV
jgi:hypothetical protein